MLTLDEAVDIIGPYLTDEELDNFEKAWDAQPHYWGKNEWTSTGHPSNFGKWPMTATVINFAFSWEQSAQGHLYWANIHNDLSRGGREPKERPTEDLTHWDDRSFD